MRGDITDVCLAATAAAILSSSELSCWLFESSVFG
jgi:hypothetical protein